MKITILSLLLFVTPALAIQPDEILKDTVLEERARVIGKELRTSFVACLLMTYAPLARDLRVLVRKRLQAGESSRGYKVCRRSIRRFCFASAACESVN